MWTDPGRAAPLLVETTATAFNRDQSSRTAVNLRGLGGLQATVAIFRLFIGTLTGGIMAYMFVQILAPLFTILPTSPTARAGQLLTLVTLVLGGMALSVALAASSLRRLNPVELLREE